MRTILWGTQAKLTPQQGPGLFPRSNSCSPASANQTHVSSCCHYWLGLCRCWPSCRTSEATKYESQVTLNQKCSTEMNGLMTTNRDEGTEGTWKGCPFLCASVKRGLRAMWSPEHRVKLLGSAQQPHFRSVIPPGGVSSGYLTSTGVQKSAGRTQRLESKRQSPEPEPDSALS